MVWVRVRVMYRIMSVNNPIIPIPMINPCKIKYDAHKFVCRPANNTRK